MFGGPPNKSLHVIYYTMQGVVIIKSFMWQVRFKAWKLVRNTLDSGLSNIATSFIFYIFLYQNYICALSLEINNSVMFVLGGGMRNITWQLSRLNVTIHVWLIFIAHSMLSLIYIVVDPVDDIHIGTIDPLANLCIRLGNARRNKRVSIG